MGVLSAENVHTLHLLSCKPKRVRNKKADSLQCQIFKELLRGNVKIFGEPVPTARAQAG